MTAKLTFAERSEGLKKLCLWFRSLLWYLQAVAWAVCAGILYP